VIVLLANCPSSHEIEELEAQDSEGMELDSTKNDNIGEKCVVLKVHSIQGS
jgi:hypothetical protein